MNTNKHPSTSFDQQREKLSAIKDALHLCIRMIFSELPVDAHILCVGAGTGSELSYMANEFRQWKFTAIDPSENMLDQCRKRMNDQGFDSRCTFHVGDLASFSSIDRYDAATSILVSHYVVELENRVNYFSKIASLLKPKGIFLNADLSNDISVGSFEEMLEVWGKMQEYSGMSVNINSFRRTTTMVPRSEFERILQSCGFSSPTLFFQNLFIYAWFSRRFLA